MADLIVADESQSDRLLTEKQDEYDATGHLARQLGLASTFGGDIHGTLMFVLEHLDDLIRDWPPPEDSPMVGIIAEEAIKGLTPIEIYTTLLAGPGHWREHKIQAETRVERLPVHLQAILAKCLRAELRRMLQQWVKWDVRGLRDRYAEAQARIAAKEAEDKAAREQAAARTAKARPRGKRIPPPPQWSPPSRDYPGPSRS
ncbi:MAG: hypothetical protein ACLGI8_07070 [Acidimicrobiia bacterium]